MATLGYFNVSPPQKLLEKSELYRADGIFSALSKGVQLFVDCLRNQCENVDFVKC